MRILIVGDWTFEVYERPLAEALEQTCAAEVRAFKLHDYFGDPEGRVPSVLERRVLRLQHRLAWGPGVRRANTELIEAASNFRPDVVLIRSRHIWKETLETIKASKPRPYLVLYTNDNPFSAAYHRSTWRHFVNCIPAADLVLSYRPSNCARLRDAGAKRVEMFRAWFVPKLHYPVETATATATGVGADACFVGHYEDDGRLEVIEELAANGLTVRVFGTGWERARRHSEALSAHPPVRLGPAAYRDVVSTSTVSLCFLSRMNDDSYTRRCFEIPAIGGVLLSERTSDQLSLFSEDQEALFFSNADEAVAATKRLVVDQSKRNDVSLAGRKRVWQDGHDIDSRARLFVDYVGTA